MDWAYGVTTIPSRRNTTLIDTLKSLASAGFGTPRLFVDDCGPTADKDYRVSLNLQVTAHFQRIGAVGNWWLALWELYIRNPHADRYALFQDDILCVQNLRPYLERYPFPGEEGGFPHSGYLNLYTSNSNASLVPKDNQGIPIRSWYPSNQMGKGALGLVFNQLSLRALLTHPHFHRKIGGPEPRSTESIDGGVIQAIIESQMAEYVHYPSLIQHVGSTPAIVTPSHPYHPNNAAIGPKWQFIQSPCFEDDLDPLLLPHNPPSTQDVPLPKPSSPPTPTPPTSALVPSPNLSSRTTMAQSLPEIPIDPPSRPLLPFSEVDEPPARQIASHRQRGMGSSKGDSGSEALPEIRFGTLIVRAMLLAGKSLDNLTAWLRRAGTRDEFWVRMKWAERWAVECLAEPVHVTQRRQEYDARVGT